MPDLDALFSPRSIALVGAYTRANPEAVRALAAANFPCFASGHDAAGALAALVEYREFLDSRPERTL